MTPLLLLLRHLSLPEWRHHAARHAAALVAVTLGVGLALSVQLINDSALSEFTAAVRATTGQPDLVLEAANRAGIADTLLDDLAPDPGIAVASPVIELDSAAHCGAACNAVHPGRRIAADRLSVHLVGIDALRAAAVTPELMPRPGALAGTAGNGAGSDDAFAALAPDRAWLNASALQRLGLRVGEPVELLASGGWQAMTIAGTVAAAGAPLVVVDIAAAQSLFGLAGHVSRIDLRLAPGVTRDAWLAGWTPPTGVRIANAEDPVERATALSRAYRVNLSVLALVALAVGGFLVYSVTALSVAQRSAEFALLGVLGLGAGPRQRLVLAESAVLGAVGGALGVALGIALAALALGALGGDLGGGYFGGNQPTLRVAPLSVLGCGLLGVAATLAGAWWPSRQAARLSPADALKGLGRRAGRALSPAWGLALVVSAGALGLMPPVAGLPLAAYAAVALLLGGGVLLVPAVVAGLLAMLHPHQRPLLLLAVERARHARGTASAAVAGVVASLALSVALTVMVASFRDAVSLWLQAVLPADLYLRSASTNAGSSEQGTLNEALVERIRALPGVVRLQPARSLALSLRADRPPVALFARPLADPVRALPLVGDALSAVPGEIGAWVSEPAAAIHQLSPGDRLSLPLAGGPLAVRVRGVWRDYARQFGAIAIDLDDYRRATGDRRINDLALWLAPGVPASTVIEAARALVGEAMPLDAATTAELRRISLAIFDRSFAVTVYLQAVAIVVGLVGIAASLSAQVLARRKEFGLLTHLGLTRRQILGLVAGETLAWLVAGTLLGLATGAAVALLLVKVVNPQSFHWTMDLVLPAGRLAVLAAGVVVAGTLTAWLSARGAGGASAVMAVKEDW